jgi:hypothetical protein
MIVVAIVAIAVPMLVVSQQTQSTRGAIGALVLVLVAALVLIITNITLRLAGFDADASEIAGQLASDPDQRRLLSRWLERARWARFVGGFSGCLMWALGTQTKGDLLLLGTGGIAVGAMLAELHHIRPRTGPRTARLDVRSVGDYMMGQDARRMIGVGLAACVVAVTGAVDGEARAAMW